MRSALLPWFALSLVASAAKPVSRLDQSSLERVHAQRIEWIKQRTGIPPLGIYQDFRAVFTHSQAPRAELLKIARDSGVQVVFSGGPAETKREVLFLPPPGDELHAIEIYRRTEEDRAEVRRLRSRLKEYPDEAFGAATDAQPERLARWDEEAKAGGATGLAWSDAPEGIPLAVAFRNSSTHILARELSEKEIRASLGAGHAYVAHDWLCDPNGFLFVAHNNLGAYDMGDSVPTGPLAGDTQLESYVPVKARLKLIHEGEVVAEAVDSKLSYTVRQPGAYRLEAWLPAAGEDRPWIFSNPIYVGGGAEIHVPSAEAAPNVEIQSDIVYVDGAPAEDANHRLDLYVPKGRTSFPVLLFVHGGVWRSGDRSLYRALGNRFAQAGIGVAIPSYRAAPGDPVGAQVEDVASALAWVYGNISKYGGDPKRMYLGGHSAGARVAALLGLNPEYLNAHAIPADALRGVIAMSGMYVEPPAAGPPAPPGGVAGETPPFLISYCQWDHLGLPKQARDFASALKKAFVSTQLVYVPRETHVSEIGSLGQHDNPLAQAILSFIR